MRRARSRPSPSCAVSTIRTAASTSSASVAARPGRGLGVAFLSLLLDEAFGELKAHRFWLDCFADNARAQRAYGKLGFAREGVLREAYRLPDGSRKDLVVMGLLKPEWEARRTACSFEGESVISIR